MVTKGSLTTAGKEAADRGEDEFKELVAKERTPGGRIPTGRAHKRKAMHAITAGLEKRQKKTRKATKVSCQFFITKTALIAKQEGTKVAEGRWGLRAWKRKKGDMIQYFCNPVTNWVITTTPKKWGSIWEAIDNLGWKGLMPWASDRQDTFRRYCEMFARAPLTLEEALIWHSSNVSTTQPFVTWRDEQVKSKSKSDNIAGEKFKGLRWGPVTAT